MLLSSNADSLSELYRERRLPLVRLAKVLVDDLDTAEDVVQDVFAKLSRKRPGAENLSDAYLRTAVLNTARSVLRRRYRRRQLPWWRPDLGDLPVYDRGLVSDQIEALSRYFDLLPPRQKEVLALRYYGGLTTSEVAAALSISASAVSSSESLALKKLSDYLGASHG